MKNKELSIEEDFSLACQYHKEKNFKYFDNFGVDEIYYNYKYFKF